MNEMGMHIVVTGDSISGLFFYGPFKTYEHAIEWAKAEFDNLDCWWIAPLAAPDEER